MNEQMGMYEIFIEKKLPYEDVALSIIKSANIPPEKVGSQYDFYEPSPKENCLSIGIEVAYYKEGYLSYISLVSMPEISIVDYYKMCKYLAFDLSMNVATYNHTEDADKILVFYPDGFYQEAIEDCNVQDGFIIQVYGNKINVDALIQENK